VKILSLVNNTDDHYKFDFSTLLLNIPEIRDKITKKKSHVFISMEGYTRVVETLSNGMKAKNMHIGNEQYLYRGIGLVYNEKLNFSLKDKFNKL